MRLVEAVDPYAANTRILLDLTLHRDIQLERTVQRPLRDIAQMQPRLPLFPAGCGFLIGNQLGVRAECPETFLDDGDAEFIKHPLRAFVFPPVEALEDASLKAFAGVVLK